MKKPIHGPSIYYATDKNIFDALNQSKVDIPTVAALFRRRNIIISTRTQRELIAEYFSRLTHDYYDHQDIAARLGIIPRKERITSMSVKGIGEIEQLQAPVQALKKELEAAGDIVQVSRNGDKYTLLLQYSSIDYKRSEFSQIQVRDGTIEFIKDNNNLIIRNTQNEYINGIRDNLLSKIEKNSNLTLEKAVVSLFDIPTPKLRSKFFHELTDSLDGLQRLDVTDVYIFKPKPEADSTDSDVDDSDSIDPDTHIERVLLRGNGVTRSEFLAELLDEEDYYITKIGWTSVEAMGKGDVFDIEAVFANPKDCTGFSFMLSGVYPREEGRISSKRRAPSKMEIERISKLIEMASMALVNKLRSESINTASGVI